MRWKPKDRQRYWFITNNGSVDWTVWYDGNIYDTAHYLYGNCFRTRKEAEQAAVKVRKLLLGLQRGK